MTHKGTVTLETERLILRRFTVDDAELMFANWASDPDVSKFLTWPTHVSVDVTKSVISSWMDLYSNDDNYSWAIVLKELGEPTSNKLEKDNSFEVGIAEQVFKSCQKRAGFKNLIPTSNKLEKDNSFEAGTAEQVFKSCQKHAGLKNLIPIGSIAAVKQDPRTNMVEIGYCIGRLWWGKGYTSEALRRLVEFFFEEVGANRIEARHDTRNQNSGKVMLKAGLRYEGTLRGSGRNNQGICDVAHYAILAEDYLEQRQKERPILLQKINYRIAVPDDAAELMKLNDLFNGDGCNNMADIESSLKNNTQEIVCVADNGEVLIGFCCGQIFKSMCYDENYSEITELYVMEPYRRQGVASGLMTLIESVFQKHDIHHCQLFTGRENTAGQAFYQKHGYLSTAEVMLQKQL